ncbi:MAG TPA: neprosin family prolyl endopeptidase [Terrimicrobium sp.]
MAERNPYDDDADGASKLSSRRPEQAASDRIDEIRQYLSDLHARRNVIKRTVTKSGQELDWVPIESQTKNGKIAAPPDETRAEIPHDRDRPTRRVPLELDDPDAELGPPGTVPLARYPIDLIAPDGDLRDWLSKTGHSRRMLPPDALVSRASPPGYNVHAAAFHSGTSYGTEGMMNVARPWVEWSDEFSLGQFWVTRGIGAQTQTVEAGLQVRKDSYGDWEPHVFVFYTTNNYGRSGDFIGGYDQDIRGWVQVSQVIYPRTRISPISQIGGTQYEMDFKVQLSLGNWWIKVNGQWMGYYPNGLFATTGLRNEADQVNWGGEVFDALSHPETTATDMGSGLFPWEGFSRAAYMRNLMIQTDQAGTMTAFTGSASADQTDCYDIKADLSGSGVWGSYFYWGGTGRNSACP